MQNVKTRQFEKRLFVNGYHYLRTKGSHAIYQNSAGRIISIPIASSEINGCIARKIVKEYQLA